ncbi:cupin domain-containing protein [Maridesulfovibrio frigidus]|uniref:cupin domain-containing protein n=1 Tax=Maridesulfovibrio frigidus TaxID=340956 RepID=UPI0004E12B72|nr:cupin domain-containing protein [Maridesulfovibrio frigidus]
MNNLFSKLDTGTIAGHLTDTSTQNLAWNQHPAFKGVSLKHLVTSTDTDGKFSAHLVKLEPGAKIGDHTHETSWEMHEVAEGSGYCILDGRNIPYEKGVVAILPENTAHLVQAGDEGLFLLAKFIPALL